MGWMWASPSPQTLDTTTTTTTTSTTTTSQETMPPPNRTQPSNDNVDAELASFMALIQADLAGTDEPTQPAPRTTTAPPPPPSSEPVPKKTAGWFSWVSSSSSSTPDRTSDSQLESSKPAFPFASFSSSSETSSATTTVEPPKPSPTSAATPGSLADQLLPKTMSCRAAFDAAFYCHGLGGQWNAIYRQGSVKSCSEHWDDFWFCMRTRASDGPVKENLIREHYRQRELARYGPGQPSSEDIWESRTEKVEPGTVFRAQYEDPDDVSDEEWRRRENERRKMVREIYGFEDGKKTG